MAQHDVIIGFDLWKELRRILDEGWVQKHIDSPELGWWYVREWDKNKVQR